MPKSSRIKRILVPTLTVVGIILIWELAVRLGWVPDYLLPAPSQVFEALAVDMSILLEHSYYTIIEALAGLAIGSVFGVIVAVLIDRFETLSLALNPLITFSQTIPSIAIAPLLVLWFGYGMLPKMVLVVISTFFPIAVSMISGLRSVDQDQISLLRTMGASQLQIFRYVKLPSAATAFFSGLRIAATWAISGAVIAEWLGGTAGLGVYMTRVRKSFSYDRLFAAVILISALTLILTKLVDALEWLCLPWQRLKLPEHGARIITTPSSGEEVQA